MKPTASTTVLYGILVVMTIVSSNLNWSKNNWDDILEADARGYYAYLPAVFIYQDLNFGFFDPIEKVKYYNKNLYYDYRIGSCGYSINKYYCGTAFAELPFFLIAHALAHFFHLDADGYSKVYPVLISISALFYLFLGLFYLKKTLHSYGLSERNTSITLVASVFGTNLFYYTVGEPGMSHVFSFAFVSMFIYFSRCFFETKRKKYFIFLPLVLGIIVLIRPVNILVLGMLPFLAGNWIRYKEGVQSLLKNIFHFLVGVACFAAILSIQLIIYKLSTDHFFVYSYGEEGFHFSDPHIIDILFSYKKGLFLYTPLYLFSLAGVCFLWKRSKFEFYSGVGFFIILTYVLSSWWMWFYGGSFSSRVYVEYIPFFMILLGVLLSKMNSNRAYKMIVFSILSIIVLCQVQTYQYRYTLIHWSDMTKEKYWDVFLRVDKIGK